MTGAAGLVPDDPQLYELLDTVGAQLLENWPTAFPAGRARPPLSRLDADDLRAAWSATVAAVPAQGSADRLLATNGRWQLIGLHLLDLPVGPLAVLQAAVFDLSAALADREAGRLEPAVVPEVGRRSRATPERVVGDLARALALLDLPADPATRLLRGLIAAPHDTPLRLDHRAAEAYRQLARRTTSLLVPFKDLLPTFRDDEP